MKKVCIVTTGNLYIVPYIETYTKHIDGELSIIYWDRINKKELYPNCNCYRYYREIKAGDKINKLVGYIGFRKFVKRILSSKSYDVVVMLQTLGGLMIPDLLCKNYKKRYIIDIRDYTYEKNRIIYEIEKRLVKNSLFCVISSPGYKNFLPSYKYVVAHNVHQHTGEKVEEIRNRNKEKTCLHIAFVGFVNYQDNLKKFILCLKNDSRFRFSFIGTRAEELQVFCDENQIENVQLVGTFDTGKTLDFYEDVDFVNNLYGNHTPVLDYALSNKLYYAAELRIPILVCPDTFMENVTKKFQLGVTIDIEKENIGDMLYSYYKDINWNIFDSNCEKFLEEVRKEQEHFEMQLKQSLR